jgi:hypothetical protein
MEAAQALDGDDLALLQQGQGSGERVVGQPVSFGVEQKQLRAAFRAAIGLGVKTPVSGRRYSY